MSNRRRLPPPPSVRQYASAYRCSGCPSTAGQFRRDGHCIRHVEIQHDKTCPVLTGAVDSFGDVLAAAVRTAASGLGVLYVRGPR